MKHISILVPKGAASLSCIEGTHKIFSTANDFLIAQGKPALFKVQLIGLTREAQKYEGVFSVKPDLTIHDTFKTDLIVIPAVNGIWSDIIESNKDFFPWINKHYKNGSEVASLCVGAFLLAATGLIEGKKMRYPLDCSK